MRTKRNGAIYIHTEDCQITLEGKCPKRKQGVYCLNPLKRRQLDYTSKAAHFVRECFEKDDHYIRVGGLSLPPERECDTQDQSKGQSGDSFPPIDLIPGNTYIIYWEELDKSFAGILLPHDHIDELENIIGESVELVGLLNNIPSCYLYDSRNKVFSRDPDYERNRGKRSELYFAFVFFDGVKFPSESSLAWVHIDLIQEWNEKNAQAIELSQQAINYFKKQAKSKIRHYGSDDEIPDSEADDGGLTNIGLCYTDPLSRLSSRSHSRDLQPRRDESNQEIIIETQEEPEVSIVLEKRASQRDPSEDCLPSIESKDLLNEGLDLEQQFSQYERQVIDSPPASNQATQMASRCMNGAQENSQAQQSIITWKPYGEVAQHRISQPQDASNDKQVSSANLSYTSTELARTSQSPPVPGTSTLPTLLPVANLMTHESISCEHQALKAKSTSPFSSEALTKLSENLEPALRPQYLGQDPEAPVSFFVQGTSLVKENQVQPHIPPQQAAAVILPTSLVGEGYSAAQRLPKRALSQHAPRQVLSLAGMCTDSQPLPTSYGGSVTRGVATVSPDPSVYQSRSTFQYASNSNNKSSYQAITPSESRPTAQHPICLQSPQDHSGIGISRWRPNTPGNWKLAIMNSPMPVEVGTFSKNVYPRSAPTVSSPLYGPELQAEPTRTKDRYL